MADGFGAGFGRGFSQSLSQLPDLLLKSFLISQKQQEFEEEKKLNKLKFKFLEAEENRKAQKAQSLESLAQQFAGPTTETEAADVPIGEIEKVPGGRLRAGLLRAGETKMAFEGLPGFAKSGGFTLSPGQTRFTEQGEPMVTAPGFAGGMAGIQEQIVRNLATDPKTGNLDPNKAMEVVRSMRTNPQGAESRVFDILLRQSMGQQVAPGELEAVESFKSFLHGAAGARAGGAETGRMGVRATPEFRATESGVSAAKRAGSEIAQRQFGQLSQTEQQAIAAHTQILANLEFIKETFSEEEIGKFVGLLNRPFQETLLTSRGIFGAKGSERFAEFKAAAERMRSAAFGEGGKQLTPFEASVVFGFTPTGREAGGATEFLAKMRNLEAFSTASRKARLELARGAKGELDLQKLDELLRKELQNITKTKAGSAINPGRPQIKSIKPIK